GYGDERRGGEDELDSVEAEEAGELLDEGVARLGEDRHEVVTLQLVDHRYHRQAADELRDESVFHKVFGKDLLEQLAGVLVRLRRDRRPEPHASVADAPLDHLVEVGERAAADEQDV